MWANYHTHSEYCDGKGTLQSYIEEATLQHVTSLGFSSHAPLPFDCKWSMEKGRLNDYLTSIENLKSSSSITLHKSLEIDFIPGVVGPNDFKQKLDYTIGSIHFVDQFADGTHWEIDGLHNLFLQGLENIFHNKIEHAISRYFEITREMIKTSCPDVVGHLDKIKIQNTGNKFYSENDQWYKEQVFTTIDVIKKSGAIIEVNTRGIYQKKSDTTYPSPWILEVLHERKIPVTISSDAHHPKDLTNQFAETADLLYNTGFRELAIYKEGSWKLLPFDMHGIKG